MKWRCLIMAKQVLKDEQRAAEGTKLDTSRLTVTVVDNHTGETLINEKVANVLLSGLQMEEEDGNTFASSAVGEFLDGILIQSLESTIDVVIHNLKARYDLESYQLLELMEQLTENAMERNFSKEEHFFALIQSMSKRSRKG